MSTDKLTSFALETLAPENIEALYRKHQVSPAPFHFLPNPDRRYCALGVVNLELAGGHPQPDKLGQKLGLTLNQALLIARGFDDAIRGLAVMNETEEAQLGARIGAHCRKVFTE